MSRKTTKQVVNENKVEGLLMTSVEPGTPIEDVISGFMSFLCTKRSTDVLMPEEVVDELNTMFARLSEIAGDYLEDF